MFKQGHCDKINHVFVEDNVLHALSRPAECHLSASLSSQTVDLVSRLVYRKEVKGTRVCDTLTRVRAVRSHLQLFIVVFFLL